jgi:hypothetical protein
MVASEDRFGFARDSPFRLADTTDPAGLDDVVRRYLAAFGPASPADATEWSGLPSLAATFDKLRDELLVFADERGRELFDLPEAPRPAADTPAPIRFLPDFDNLILGHADRSRVLPDEHRRHVTTKNLRVNATVLYDGEVCATWKLSRSARRAKLEVTPLTRLTRSQVTAIEPEAAALLAAFEPDATSAEVAFATP